MWYEAGMFGKYCSSALLEPSGFIKYLQLGALSLNIIGISHLQYTIGHNVNYLQYTIIYNINYLQYTNFIYLQHIIGHIVNY